MKLATLLSFLAFGLAAGTSLAKTESGPKGGRLLDAPPHRAEFFVTAERKAEITFYDGNLRPVVHTGHRVTLIAELPKGRQTIELVETPAGLASAAPLPEGGPYRIVVQFRTGPQGKTVNYRIDLDLATCGECRRAEYACTCGH